MKNPSPAAWCGRKGGVSGLFAVGLVVPVEPVNGSGEHVCVARLRGAPADQFERALAGLFEEVVQLQTCWTAGSADLLPEPLPVAGDDLGTVPVATDRERIAERRRPPDVDPGGAGQRTAERPLV